MSSQPAHQPPPLPTARLNDAERIACLRLIRTPSVGPVTFRELINVYGGAHAALDALPELSARSGRRALSIPPASRAEAELAAAEKAGARALFTIDPGYPMRLATLDAPPPCLYVKGNAELLSTPSVALVGSRKCSANGIAITRQLAAGVGAAGYVTVSGLARGIDAAAHEASLATGTVAVVAGGIDVVYPPEHDILLARIAEEGVVVAELPPGYQPRAQDFPRRNRIIAGLALGVVVVEAAQRSGSLVTARYAEEFDRTVMAVPGHPRDPRAYGTNRLIRDGATLIATTEHVLQELVPMTDRTPVRPHQSTRAAHGPTGFEEHAVRPPSLPQTSS
ncbi:MAG: DNA-processing protein DprA, partial [Pseudomonadota bacterium]